MSDVFTTFLGLAKPLIAPVDEVMRGESPLTAGERELLFAHVIRLNACEFCFGAHNAIAKAYGVEESLFESMLTDLELSEARGKLKTQRTYTGKLTALPRKMLPVEEQLGCAAGWHGKALHDL